MGFTPTQSPAKSTVPLMGLTPLESKSLSFILLPSPLIFFPPSDKEEERKHSRPSKEEVATKSELLMDVEKA